MNKYEFTIDKNGKSIIENFSANCYIDALNLLDKKYGFGLYTILAEDWKVEYKFNEMLRAELEKLLGEYTYYKMCGTSILSDTELQELTEELKNR